MLIKAIGEVGLDYHWIKDKDEQELQEKLFIECIELANEFNKPLVIHSRKAELPALNVLEKYSQVPVLLHSFEGNLQAVTKAIDLGYKITIPTNVVIRKNRRKVAQRAGLENIMIETDSPYCPPAMDIKPNTPSTIPIAAKKLSEILDVEFDDIAHVTTNNVKESYGL